MTSDTQKSLEATWVETLAALGSPRTRILPTEQLVIARAVSRIGDAEMVRMALIGARYEPRTEKFDPKDYVDIQRVLCKDKFGRDKINLFIEWGYKAVKRGSKAAPVETHQPEEYAPPSDEVKAFLGKIRMRNVPK